MKRDFEMRSFTAVLLAAVAAFLIAAFPVQAIAAPGNPASDPTASQYQDPASTVVQSTPDDDQDVTLVSTPASNDSGGSDGSSSGSLPFTGFDVGILALVAVLLAATGFALRRFSDVK